MAAIVERSEARDVRVGQAVCEDALNLDGVARVDDEGGLRVSGNEEIETYQVQGRMAV